MRTFSKVNSFSPLKSILLCLFVGLPGCGWDGHFDFLGYTTRPNYDRSISTVYVPIFQNITLVDTVRRGVEEDLTKAVQREIMTKTPYQVASNPAKADSELIGKIVNIRKSLINSNQINEIREGQVIMTVEIIWRDLRPDHVGELLSAPRQGGVGNRAGPPDPKAPPPPPVVVQGTANFAPELGGSMTSALQLCVNNVAIQIVSMMEKPW